MEGTFENKVEGRSVLNYEKQRFSRLESAEYLGVSVVTIDRALASGKLSCFRIGRRVIFDKKHLDEYLARNEYRATIG
jgi:excisionase family DNA binding protein